MVFKLNWYRNDVDVMTLDRARILLFKIRACNTEMFNLVSNNKVNDLNTIIFSQINEYNYVVYEINRYCRECHVYYGIDNQRGGKHSNEFPTPQFSI